NDGRSTFLTLLNASNVFGLQRVALVSQDYHLPRALYIARRLGIQGYGLRAFREDESQPPPGSGWNAREWFSRVKDFTLVRVYRWFHARCAHAMYRIAFLINPASGGGVGAEVFSRLEQVMESFGMKHEAWTAELTDATRLGEQ